MSAIESVVAPGWPPGRSRFGVTQKIACLLLLPFTGSLLLAALVGSYLSESAQEVAFLSQAGRQRVIAEQLLGYSQMVQGGQDEDRPALARLADRFAGGLVTLRASAAGSQSAVTPALDRLAARWEAIEPSFREIAAGPLKAPGQVSGFDRISSGAGALIAASEGVVSAYRRWLVHERGWLLRGTLLGVACSLALLGGGLWLARAWLVRPLRRATGACREILEGGGLAAVPVVSDDEMGDLARALNDLSSEVARLLAALDVQVKQWRGTFQAIADPVYLHDRSFRIQRANRAAERAAGVGDGALVGRLYHEAFGMGGPLASCQRARERGRPDREEWIDPAGSVWLIESHPLVGEVGYEGAVHVHRDVTEQRRAEVSLQASQAYLQALVEGAGDAIVVADAEGTIEIWNPAAERLFGYAASEALGQGLELIIPEPVRAVHGGYLRRYLQTGQARILGRRVEVQGARRDGSTLPLELLVTELRHPGGVGFVGIARDLTEQQEAKAKLGALRRSLVDASRSAGMAEVATGILHNVGNVLNSVGVSISLCEGWTRASEVTTLARVVAMLSDRRDDLAAFLTEDPKGRRVLQLLEAVSEALITEQQAHLKEVAGLHKSLEHLKVIVGTQQQYTRAAGLVEAVEIASVVGDAIALSPVPAGVRIERRDQALPPLLIDRHRVVMILTNLISNARHAIGAGAGVGTIEIVTEAEGLEAGAGSRVRVQVRDDGAGIEPALLERIFEMGFTTRPDGHGYGLHSSANAAQQMGGRLWAESAGAERGSTFVLALPLRLAGEEEG